MLNKRYSQKSGVRNCYGKTSHFFEKMDTFVLKWYKFNHFLVS